MCLRLCSFWSCAFQTRVSHTLLWLSHTQQRKELKRHQCGALKPTSWSVTGRWPTEDGKPPVLVLLFPYLVSLSNLCKYNCVSFPNAVAPLVALIKTQRRYNDTIAGLAVWRVRSPSANYSGNSSPPPESPEFPRQMLADRPNQGSSRGRAATEPRSKLWDLGPSLGTSWCLGNVIAKVLGPITCLKTRF